ncbi:putative ATP-dependent RNA helicase TDRD12 [Leucoraja erinacea]|uniref:putative ATP-dependent RNA helicase TDRD12 n=1 Tax=Leucoraja erinaceus TaxID=7782 RepID=UPI0024584B6E|nr:putative ATP-dependent RNA helicase TDRD12 [Leucoraja erinacea]
MIQIVIIKVEDSGCFWGRIPHGFSDLAENENQYERLEVKMNQLYHRSHEELEEIKLPVLEQGQICAIYCHELRCWCRAVLESLVPSGSSYLAECFLVDHAKHILVKAKDVRRAVDTFWKLPYRAKKFNLFGIQPMTLNFNVCEEKAIIGPAKRWDSAAIQYFQKLSQESQTAEAKLKDFAGDTIAVQLYLTLKDEKVCLNDDLVAKMFAHYISPKKQNLSESQTSSELCRKKETPVKNNVDYKTLALWSEILEGSTIEEQSQGFSGQESDVQCQQGQERSISCEHMSKQTSKTPSLSHHPTSAEPLQAIFLSEMHSDEKMRYVIYRMNKFLGPRSRFRPFDPLCLLRHSVMADLSLSTLFSCFLPVTFDTLTNQQFSLLPLVENLTRPWRLILLNALHVPITTSYLISKCRMYVIALHRLLQFLNPDPFNTKRVLHPQQPSLKIAFDRWSSVLVHAVNKLTPCSSMEFAPISLDLKKELCKKNISPDVVQSYCWPAISRGCDLVAVSRQGDDPLLYIPPLLTFLQFPSVYSFQPKRNLPSAIIVCPGQKKAHFVCQVLSDLTKFSQRFNLSLVLVGQDPEESKKIKLVKGCDVVVTTPHSLVRVLKTHCLFFIRLGHLVLDTVDVLFDKAMDEVTTILQCFREATNVPERLSTPQQLIAVGKQWRKEMDILVKESHGDPYVVIAAMEEAALYGNVHQIVQLCLDHEKTSQLLTILDFTSEVVQKTVILANCAEEVDHLCKALDSNSNFCIKAHEGRSWSQIMEQWNNKFSPGTHVILVTTDECLQALGITDATNVIHYSFPSSQEIFGARLCCMVDNFKNLIIEESTLRTQSIIIMSDKNAPQIVSFLQYLERTEAKIPTELYKFISNLNDKDDNCYDKSICKYLKAYGICRDIKTCASRHKIHPNMDKPRRLSNKKCLPSRGYVEIIPTWVSDASIYYGRIIHHRNKWENPPVSLEDDYLTLLKDMAEYYMDENHQKPVEQLKLFALYALQEKMYCRVQLMALPPQDQSTILSNAEVKYIDSGQTGRVMQKQLLELPAKFQLLPAQIVEFIVSKVKPIDHEKDWNPQVSRFIKQKISNKSLEAKIVLALGNTLWLHPVVHLSKLPDLKTTILDYNIRSEIMNSGFGADNVRHIERVQALCREAGFDVPDEDSSQEELSYGKDLECAILENDGNYHSVIISEFYTPECFYLQAIANQEKLRALEDEINQQATEKQDHIQSSYVPIVGDICLAFCTTKKRWRRVKIMSADYFNNNCHVLFVDFGSYSWISMNKIQPLMKAALALPFQAICCSLFGVERVGKNWNPEIKELIWTTFQTKELQAKVIEQSRNESTNSEYYHVDLQDPTNGCFITLSECIISRGCGRGTPAAMNQLFPEKALENGQRNSILCLCSSLYALLGDEHSSSLRISLVEELKNLVLHHPAEGLSESGCLRYLCRLLRFLSTPKEQADVIVAMTHKAKTQVQDYNEINEERGIYVLVSLLQGTANSELQESVCIALGILGKSSDLYSSFTDANALKLLCDLLKMPVKNNIWQAVIEALAELLSSNRFCEEVENQQIVSHLCAKIHQSSEDKVLENILRVLCHLTGRAESMNLMLANGLELTIDRLLLSTSSKSILYKVANKMKFSLTSLQNVHLQNDAVYCEGNNDIMDIPREKSSQSTVDHKSFHPEIKWHQKDDHLVLNVKLQNVTRHSCRFDHCKVIFSASVDAKLYVADLELQGSILEGKCSCIIKNAEPVIMLFKEERGAWSSLLKLKNPNVTFDFNYFEEMPDDGTLPIFNDMRSKGHPLVLEPIVDEWNSLTNYYDSSEEDY